MIAVANTASALLAQDLPRPTAPSNTTESPTELPARVQQLLIGVTEDWDSSTGKLWRFELSDSSVSPGNSEAESENKKDADRVSGPISPSASASASAKDDAIDIDPGGTAKLPHGREWQRLTTEDGVDILLGRNGLAWGRGALRLPPALSARHAGKSEGDGRAPAGCFAITRIYGDDHALPEGAAFPYRQVTDWDAWPDDPKHPQYNQHVVIDPANGVPSWFEDQRMRRGDPAYRWLVEIRHNADPPQPGAGSAIFFHTRRGPDRLTSGCTTMSQGNLAAVIRWLKIEKNPHYILLPMKEYRELASIWRLPALPRR